ncbi:cyclic nucleotide-gated ion channel 15 [Pyrus ussuriensis x Pyrus communis]|uniref:Cyclic nucleotide-gated ion channel 15 n=1 Tax=Pyrus ussuriensis x Pyrus communis TaxID=2448454 RepID=A0A5N5F2F6_9ROSA|nr:cyclic nucleotide-gated ion channel 15 [Pyrus ussuriensis x Pyrus communis]
MLFIVDRLVSIKKRSSSNHSKRGAGELCGEELLRWPFSTFFPDRKPLATEYVKAIRVLKPLLLKQATWKAHRHRRMMKEEMEQHIDWLMPKNRIPERLNQDMKSRILEKVEQQFQQDKVVYWDNLDFDWHNLISLLPLDFQNEIKSYMPLTKLKKVKFLQSSNP